MADQNELMHSFARLSSLKANLPDHVHVPEKYVQEFHLVLDNLTRATNLNLESYRIPPDEIRKRVTVTGPRGTRYSDSRFCDRPFLMMKIDAVLHLFRMATSENRPIGFGAS